MRLFDTFYRSSHVSAFTSNNETGTTTTTTASTATRTLTVVRTCARALDVTVRRSIFQDIIEILTHFRASPTHVGGKYFIAKESVQSRIWKAL